MSNNKFIDVDIQEIISKKYKEKFTEYVLSHLEDMEINTDQIDIELKRLWIIKEDWLLVWMPLYTASYLTNKLNKNYNSVINEKICIKVWDKYILHEDIINKFKNDYLL